MTLFHSLFRPFHFSFGPQAGGDASTGAAVTLEVRAPTLDSPAQPGTSSTKTIDAGGTVFSLGSFNATVTDTRIVFDHWGMSNRWTPADFAGPVATTAGGWSAVSLDPSSNFPGFTADRIVLDGTTLAFNMQGLVYDAGTRLVVNVSALPA
jgi:hypothetical protein